MTDIEYNTRTLFVDKFDYTPWQRAERVPKVEVQQNKEKHRGSRKESPDNFSAVSRRVSAKLLPNKRSLSSLASPSPTVLEYRNSESPVFGKECSTLCRHGKPKPTIEVTKKERRISKDGTITLLKIQIKEKKKLLEESRGRYMKLIRDNVSLKDQLMGFEQSTHIDAKSLLEKYKRFKDALTIIDVEHSKVYQRESRKFEEAKERRETLVKSLNADIQSLEKNIKNEKKALNALLSYKEKEYPEKSEQIRLLQEEIKRLSESFADDMTELEGIVKFESNNYHEEFLQETKAVKQDIALSAMESLSPSVKSIAQQNDVLRKEISLHQGEMEIQKDDLKSLQKEIRHLKIARDERMREWKEPRHVMKKCAPDTELDLGIPLQRWLLI